MNPQDSIPAEQTPVGRAAPATDDGRADTGKGEDKPRSIQEVGADGKKRTKFRWLKTDPLIFFTSVGFILAFVIATVALEIGSAHV